MRNKINKIFKIIFIYSLCIIIIVLDMLFSKKDMKLLTTQVALVLCIINIIVLNKKIK